MPPEDRFVPRFAAEPPQERAPYGRWAETLQAEFLAACLRIDSEGEDLGEPGEIAWFPDRTWHGRTYVPATARTSTGLELFGDVSFAPGRRTATSPTTSRRDADFTDETAEANPDWQLDLCEEVVGGVARRGGQGRGDDARLGHAARRRAARSRRPSSRDLAVDQCAADRGPLHAARARRLPRRPARDPALGAARARARARVALRRGRGAGG